MEQTLTERAPQRRVSWSRVTGLVTAGATVAYVGLVDPATRGVYPPCPSRLLLGVDCPGCGGLRGTHDLLRGDVAGALDHNLLLIPFLAMLGYFGWRLLVDGPHNFALPRIPRWAIATAAVIIVAFTVARNLPIAGLEYLASDA